MIKSNKQVKMINVKFYCRFNRPIITVLFKNFIKKIKARSALKSTGGGGAQQHIILISLTKIEK